MIKEALSLLADNTSLTFEQASAVMEEMMNGEASPALISAFLTALRMKGETVDEIAGLAIVMRDKALVVTLSIPAIDIVGTGGDGSGSYNISTAAAFVAAGAGLHVAKHGNRAASSKCGSADVLEALGVKIDLSPDGVAKCVEQAGIGFMFAPVYHPAMKHVGPTRREIGIRTVFNILGPLTNPARVSRMVLGVPSEDIGNRMAAVLQRLGTEHSLVIHGKDGLDEMTVSDASLVWDVTPTAITPPSEVTPGDFNCKKASISGLIGGLPEENAAALRALLDGKPGAFRDAVIMNAAAALIAADVTDDKTSAAKLAAESIDSGKAREKVARLVELSQALT